MAYKGSTYQIPCDRGGYNHSANIDLIPPEAMVTPSRNINLHTGGREKRGGTSHVNETALTDEPQITGLYDWMMQDQSTQFLITASADGKLWKDFTTTIKTGLGLAKFPSFEVMDDTLFIAWDGSTPMTWDGSAAAVTDMTAIPSDWTGSNFPKQFLLHGRGVSERMWAFGFADGSNYASADGDGDDFSDANVVNIKINTGDGYGTVGGFTYGDRLFAVGKKQTYLIDDDDADSANWGYQEAQWKGGAAHHRLIVRTPNDVCMMAEDGEIYSFTSVEQYGDYKQASLTRPSHMDVWIRENLDLTKIDQFHAIHDPILRAVRFFVVRAGQTEVDTCLVYFYDRNPQEAWTIHDNQSADSGFKASCACLYREDVGTYKIYTGDYDGFVWKLETENANDNGEAYYGGYKTPHLTFDNARVSKLYNELRVITQPQGAYNLSIDWWVDGNVQATKTISLAGTGGVLDSFVLDTSLLGGNELIDTSCGLGKIGKRIQFEVYNSSADQTFFVSQLMVDFKTLGPKSV